MHILFVTTYFEPDQGAASIILTRVAKKLHQRGHQITVLTSLPNYPQGRILDGYRGKFLVVEDRDGIRVIQTWIWATSSPKISRKFISQISFATTATLRGLGIPRPDVMVIVNHPMFVSMAGVFLSWVKRVPYVMDVRDLWPDHMLSVGAMTEKHPVYRLFRWIVDRTYRGAAGIVALHDALAVGVQKHIGKDEKVKIIYSGVDLKLFKPDLDTRTFREKYGLSDRKLVTFIGTFATPYDFETMFKATQQLASRTEVQFVFIGSGSQKDVVQDYLQSDSNPGNVQWIGWVDHDEIPYAWSASHITYWALRDRELYRGIFPAKSYEAMACGIPIAAAMEGLGADILARSKGGITVASGDANGLAETIKRLLDDPDLYTATSQAARAYAEQHFDAEQAAVQYEAVLERAVQ